MKWHHVRNVFAKPLQLGSAPFEPPVFPKTGEQTEFLKRAVKSCFVFENLEPSELDPLVNAMELVEFESGHVIIKQGDVGDYFYVIEEGTVDFIVDFKNVGNAKQGDSFGELSLLYSEPRAASVQASNHVRAFRVDQKTFRFILQDQSRQDSQEKTELLNRVAFLQDLDDYSMQKLHHVMKVAEFQKDQVIIEKGDTQANQFYILHTGSVKCTKIEAGKTAYEDIVLNKSGDYFGELALVTGEPRAATVTCVTAATCYTIDKESFETILGDFKTVIAKCNDKRKLAAIKIFADCKLNQQTLSAMAQEIREVTYAQSTVLCTAGESTKPMLTFVRTGSVELRNKDGSILNTVGAGGYFGEDQLLADVDMGKHYSINAPCSTETNYTATCLEDTVCGILKLADLRKLMDTRLIGQPDAVAALLYDSIKEKDVKLEELDRHKVLGQGTFGQVWLVSRRQSRTGQQMKYALKIQSKYELLKDGQTKAVIAEKNIMAEFQHPFLIRLVNTYHDVDFVYMLLQFVQGGELYNTIYTDKQNFLDNSDARFYGACVAEGLGCMHRRGYAYRDLKPENVLIDEQGYCVIIDFGFAKYCPAPRKTFTLCGTPLYIAPELILNRGHNASADHWSLGILIYEMLTGNTPFYRSGMQQMDLFRAIVKCKPTFPDSIDPAAKNVMKAFLTKDPSRRLGSLAGGEDSIPMQEWFQSVDFDELRAKTIKPPMIPKIKDPMDTSNFENWDNVKDKSKKKYPMLSRQQQKEFDGF